MAQVNIDIPSREIREVSLEENHQAADPVQVCRTCTHRNERLWDATPVQIRRSRAKGENPEVALACRPSELTHWYKLVGEQGRFRLTSGFDPGRPQALVESCGQVVEAMCRNCANFRPVKVPVEYSAGGATRYSPYTVGGSCSLPAEGIIVDGVRVFCAPRALGPTQESSCLNCQLSAYAGTDTMIHDGIGHEAVKLDLDPYEMFMTRRDAMLHPERDDRGRPEPVAVAITKARHRLTAHPQGLYCWFPVEILDVITREQPTLRMVRPPTGPIRHESIVETVPVAYKVRFLSGVHTVATLSAHDPSLNITVYPSADGTTGQVQIMAPHHEQFRLTLDDTVRLPAYPRPAGWRVYSHTETCDACKRNADRNPGVPFPEPCPLHTQGFETQVDPLPWRPELINEDCAAKHAEGQANCCDARRQRACFFHGRDPRHNMLTGEVRFFRPSTADLFDASTRRDQYCRVEVHEDEPRFVMADGSALNVLVLESSIHSLMDQAGSRHEALALHDRLVELRRSLPWRRRSYTREIGYGAPRNLESFKPYCALSEERVLRTFRPGNPSTGEPDRWVERHISAKESDPMGFHNGDPKQPNNDMYNAKAVGINFRDVMGDRFGVKNWTMSWSETLALNERIRATNPAERLTEELLVTEALAYTWRERERLPHPERVGAYEALQVRYLHWDHFVATSYEYLTPAMKELPGVWAVEDPETDPDLPRLRAQARADYTKWLDETEIITQTSPDGTTYEVALSNRWRVHGYDNSKMARTRSDWDVTEVFHFDHARTQPDDPTYEAHQGFQCPYCFRWYDATTVLGADGNQYCPEDEYPLVWMEDDHEERVSVDLLILPDVPKIRRGVGTAVAADSQRYQTQTMLSRMCCSAWIRKGSNPRNPVTLSGRKR